MGEVRHRDPTVAAAGLVSRFRRHAESASLLGRQHHKCFDPIRSVRVSTLFAPMGNPEIFPGTTCEWRTPAGPDCMS